MPIIKEFNNCKLCPKYCSVNRNKGNLGYCKSDSELHIASIVVHKGEEPVISGQKGICNIFFSKCNMQCVYCQNYQISSHKYFTKDIIYTVNEIVDEVIEIFVKHGINSLGFVTPTHFQPYIIKIIKSLRKKGYNPVTVYNTNSYENIETIKELENYINVYLPDLKYSDDKLAVNLSDTPNYFEIATKSIKEMYRQKGSTVIINEYGICESGLIIRHLVLPKNIENSFKVLEWIAYELSPNVSVSLMSQYYPIKKFSEFDFLNSKVTFNDYQSVIDKMEELCIFKGWIQEMTSADNYIPDFNNDNPFET